MPNCVQLTLAAALLAGGLGLLSACAEEPRREMFPVGTCGRTSPPTLIRDAAYWVFFSSGSAEVSPRGKLIVQELLCQRTRLGGDGSVVITGNVDSVEARTNSDLDLRRAQAVRAVLIVGGLNPRLALLRPDGDKNRLVPTDQAEPQNRRVSLDLLGVGERNQRVANRSCADWVRRSCLAANHSGSDEACDKALAYLSM
jgi:hypothetical protein